MVSDFSWEQTSEGSKQIDLRIQRQADGHYQVSNLKDNTQTQECENADEALDQIQILFERSEPR